MRSPDPPAEPEPESAGELRDAAASGAAGRLRNLKIGLVALVAAGLVTAWRMGVFSLFSEPARVRQALVDLGPWGQVAFVVAYAVFQPFGVPGTVFVMVAPLIWPWPVAFALSMAGTMAASVVGFSFARFIARDWVSKRVPARFRRYDDALAKRGFVTVAALRFIFWMPQALHAFLGISKVPFWTHFWGSIVGYFVPLLVTSYFGERVFEWMKTAPASAWIGMGAGIVGVWVTVWLVRRRRKPAAAG